MTIQQVTDPMNPHYSKKFYIMMIIGILEVGIPLFTVAFITEIAGIIEARLIAATSLLFGLSTLSIGAYLEIGTQEIVKGWQNSTSCIAQCMKIRFQITNPKMTNVYKTIMEHHTTETDKLVRGMYEISEYELINYLDIFTENRTKNIQEHKIKEIFKPSMLKATSFYDIEIWSQGKWEEYFAEQKNYLDAGGRIQRIFILSKENIDKPEIKTMIKQQAELNPNKYKVYVIKEEDVKESWMVSGRDSSVFERKLIIEQSGSEVKEVKRTRLSPIHDFILYDTEIVLEAFQIESKYGDEKNTLGMIWIDASSSENENWIKKFEEYFEKVKKNSKTFYEFYKEPQPSPLKPTIIEPTSKKHSSPNNMAMEKK